MRSKAHTARIIMDTIGQALEKRFKEGVSWQLVELHAKTSLSESQSNDLYRAQVATPNKEVYVTLKEDGLSALQQKGVTAAEMEEHGFLEQNNRLYLALVVNEYRKSALL